MSPKTQVKPDATAPPQENASETVGLNVGGKIYQTTTSTLRKYPNTLLGRMFKPGNESLLKRDSDDNIFFDRDPDLFNYILDYHRYGFMKQLECRRKCSPKQCKCFYIDLLRLEEECDYWGLSFDDVAEDSVDVKMAQNRMEIDDRLEGFGIGIDKIAQAAATCCAEAICEGNNTVQMILEQHLKSKCSACTTTSAKSSPTKRMVVDVDDVFVQILSSGQAANKEYATISTQMITDKVKLHLDPSIGPRFQSLTLTMTNVSRRCSCGPTINIQVSKLLDQALSATLKQAMEYDRKRLKRRHRELTEQIP